jgi:hypothetical protein
MVNRCFGALRSGSALLRSLPVATGRSCRSHRRASCKKIPDPLPIAFWNYPNGGKPSNRITAQGPLLGLTVSLSRSSLKTPKTLLKGVHSIWLAFYCFASGSLGCRTGSAAPEGTAEHWFRGGPVMKIRTPFHYAVVTTISAAILSACGMSQTEGTLSNTLPSAAHALNRSSSSSGDLIYAISGGSLDVYTFPGGSFVTLAPMKPLIAICSDEQGNVFVTGAVGSVGEIREFAHGSTTVEQYLQFAGYPGSCSVDPTTGNLAVTNNTSGDSGDVGIYQGAQGYATYYTASNLSHYNACAYDDQGNLFIDGENSSGEVLDVLPAGSGGFTAITLSKPLKGTYGNLEWIGSYLALGIAHTPPVSVTIYHIKVSGSQGTVIGETKAKAKRAQHWWVQGDYLLAPINHSNSEIGFWRYPNGGKPKYVVDAGVTLIGLTVSVATTAHSRRH